MKEVGNIKQKCIELFLISSELEPSESVKAILKAITEKDCFKRRVWRLQDILPAGSLSADSTNRTLPFKVNKQLFV